MSRLTNQSDKRQLNNGTDTSSSLSAASTGQIGKVPAVPNDPRNTVRINFSTIPTGSQAAISATQSTSTSISASTDVTQAQTNGTTNNAPQNNGPKMVGIVQAIPNDPRNSPPLTSIPPIDPSKLAAVSSYLASVNANFTNTAAANPNAAQGATTTTSGSSFGIMSTTYPLVAPKPGDNPSSASPPSPTLSTASATSPAPQLAGQAGGDQDTPSIVTMTNTVVVTETASASQRRSRHHRHHSRSTSTQLSVAQASIQTAAPSISAAQASSRTAALSVSVVQASAQPGLPNFSLDLSPSAPQITPTPVTTPESPLSTLTIAALEPQIVPVDPNSLANAPQVASQINANGLTVTVTETIAETTATFIKILTTTVSA